MQFLSRLLFSLSIALQVASVTGDALPRDCRSFTKNKEYRWVVYGKFFLIFLTMLFLSLFSEYEDFQFRTCTPPKYYKYYEAMGVPLRTGCDDLYGDDFLALNAELPLT